MRGNKKDEVAQTPQPTVQQPQPAAAMPVPKEAQKITVQLDADAPNAHVTFRRHIAGTPTSTQINATDVVELVEVSAPGYKTARYWLTFDRPTHLKAHLAKGTGLAEATEEETLVALGEVSVPPQTATAIVQTACTNAHSDGAHRREAAPASCALAASVVENIAMAPRKIGKAAVADEKIEAAEDAAARRDGHRGAEAARPRPSPCCPRSRSPRRSSEPVAKVEADRKVEAPRSRRSPIGDRCDRRSSIGRQQPQRPEVQKCFADGKKKNAGLKGTISLQLQVDAGGKVHRVQVQSTLKDPLVAACVVKSANAWRFPTRAGLTRRRSRIRSRLTER